MNCKKCSREAEKGDFCSSCFRKVILSRVGKHLRAALPDRADLTISVDGDLAEHFIREALKRPFQLSREEDGRGIKVVSWTSNDLAEWFLTSISGEKASKPEGILLFEDVLSSELQDYSDIVGIKYINHQRPHLERWSSLLKRDPSMVLGLHKTIRALQ